MADAARRCHDRRDGPLTLAALAAKFAMRVAVVVAVVVVLCLSRLGPGVLELRKQSADGSVTSARLEGFEMAPQLVVRRTELGGLVLPCQRTTACKVKGLLRVLQLALKCLDLAA